MRDDVSELEAFQKQVDDLMSTPGYDASDAFRMGEAIQQASDEDQETIRDYVEQKDWAKLGLKLYTMSFEYMESLAEHEVRDYL
jgi:hypothetical protein